MRATAKQLAGVISWLVREVDEKRQSQTVKNDEKKKKKTKKNVMFMASKVVN